jgi:hypothetical protein
MEKYTEVGALPFTVSALKDTNLLLLLSIKE